MISGEEIQNVSSAFKMALYYLGLLQLRHATEWVQDVHGDVFLAAQPVDGGAVCVSGAGQTNEAVLACPSNWRTKKREA
jgi:hypothetical protein